MTAMIRPEWMDQPHEFREDIDDGSMCICGVPALIHSWVIEHHRTNREDQP